jgi:hypothetical protein
MVALVTMNDMRHCLHIPDEKCYATKTIVELFSIFFLLLLFRLFYFGLDRPMLRHAAQIDLVPTLSLLLDTPIPFSSIGTTTISSTLYLFVYALGVLGSLIPEFFAHVDDPFDDNVDIDEEDWTTLLNAYELNARQ